MTRKLTLATIALVLAVSTLSCVDFAFSAEEESGPRIRYLAYHGYVPLKDAKTKERDFAAKPGSLGAMFQYEKKDNYQDGKIEYALLKDGDGRRFGYCDERYLMDKKAILESSITSKDPDLPGPRIYRKVRLSNSQYYLATRPSDDQLKVVNIYSRPVEDPKYKVGEFRLSTLMFVYGETEDFFLLGHTTEFRETPGRPDSVENVIKGWVRKDRCIEWNTRQALEWNWRNHSVRSLPAVLFSEFDTKSTPSIYDRKLTAERAKSYMANQHKIQSLIQQNAKKEQIEGEMASLGVYSREAFEVVNGKLQLKRMRPTAMRMPLLTQSFDLDRSDGEEGYWAWELAATSLSGADETIIPDTSPADQFERLDVLLVIDATSSMREEIVASLKAVMDLAEELKNQPMIVQFAFVFFRDKQADGPKKWIEVQDYVRLPSASVFSARNVADAYDNVQNCFLNERAESKRSIQASEQALDQLLSAAPTPFFEALKKAHSVQATGAGLPPESVFDGLEHALSKELKNDQEKSLRLAIVIGDRGDNGEGDTTSDLLVRKLIDRRQIPRLLTGLNVDAAEGA
ncbi:MAG: hypothetical protein KDA84_05865, partial [Planctomycetaceae bacterium]|nr:hypothetical protein [Planctomycetaceae bacterium]